MNITANDEILTTKGKRKKGGKGGWLMKVIEVQSDIDGSFIARGKRLLKSGLTGCDFSITEKQIDEEK